MNKSNIENISIVHFRGKMNKRGWIHILEATIAVMIVAGVMMATYSQQSEIKDLSVSTYSYSLENSILNEIATNDSLRLDALKVKVDLPTDPAYDRLDNFVAEKMPENTGFLLRICNLSDPNNYCKISFGLWLMYMLYG